jgi:hypothetical protein
LNCSFRACHSDSRTPLLSTPRAPARAFSNPVQTVEAQTKSRPAVEAAEAFTSSPRTPVASRRPSVRDGKRSAAAWERRERRKRKAPRSLRQARRGFLSLWP